jgi:hypothetical protein
MYSGGIFLQDLQQSDIRARHARMHTVCYEIEKYLGQSRLSQIQFPVDFTGPVLQSDAMLSEQTVYSYICIQTIPMQSVGRTGAT